MALCGKHDQSQHRPDDHDNRDFNDALQLLVEAAHRLRHVSTGKLRIGCEFFFAAIGRCRFSGRQLGDCRACLRRACRLALRPLQRKSGGEHRQKAVG